MKKRPNLIPANPMVGRREFLKGSIATGAVIGLGVAGCSTSSNQTEIGGGATSVTLLDPASQEKFSNLLPMPARIYAAAGMTLTVPIMESRQWLGLRASDGSEMMTTVYGFEHQGQVTAPGPSIIVRSNEDVQVEWRNQLPNDEPYILPIDLTLHIPHLPNATAEFIEQKPVVIHLHGGHTESESDGNPEAWYTQEYQATGPDWDKSVYFYDNTQEAAGLWYHDHTVGMTRLNTYAGLAGMYLIKDATEDRLIDGSIIPDDDHMIEIVIHDALFDDEGNLYYPGRHGEPINPIIQKDIADNWPDPTVLDEFFGTHILVNGMAWPKVELEPNKYRLRLLNASSSRSYVLEFDNGMEFFQIGSDGGFLNSPVRLTQLVVTPAERMDIIVDFNDCANQQIILKNLGPELPFRGYVDPAEPANSMKLVYNAGGDRVISDGMGGLATIADPESTGLVMRFDIGEAGPQSEAQAINFDPTIPLREPLQLLPRDNPQTVRQLVLFNLRDDMDRTLVLMGTLESGSLFFMDETTEIVPQNSTEIWEIYNTTGSAHPMHIHQVQFQVIDRQEFNGDLVNRTQQFMDDPNRTFQGATLDLHGLNGDPVLPQPNEQGRKDTVLALAGQVTRLVAHFDRPGNFVWHCHIITHEDYDMMRKFQVTPES
ncbi:multicopper oxidase domain-containing protein [Rhodococcus sp. NPDC049939]|uniref:multicopper oxidase family protein n=1 Tax=Rhodococcus sp. NPDC049939 TaxID=3155511 RepID=UPI0033DE1FFB